MPCTINCGSGDLGCFCSAFPPTSDFLRLLQALSPFLFLSSRFSRGAIVSEHHTFRWKTTTKQNKNNFLLIVKFGSNWPIFIDCDFEDTANWLEQPLSWTVVCLHLHWCISFFRMLVKHFVPHGSAWCSACTTLPWVTPLRSQWLLPLCLTITPGGTPADLCHAHQPTTNVDTAGLRMIDPNIDLPVQ